LVGLDWLVQIHNVYHTATAAKASDRIQSDRNHNERNHNERNHNERSQSDRSQSDRTSRPTAEGSAH